MKTIAHNGSTTGFYFVDEKTGVYYTAAQPNGNFVSRVTATVISTILFAIAGFLKLIVKNGKRGE